MKLIIAGSRNLKVNPGLIGELLDQFRLKPEEIVSGDAEGIDTSACQYALKRNISVVHFKPDYATFYENPKYAPIARNQQMAEYADALLLIWDGQSKGSANMRSQMYSKGKSVYEVVLRELAR